MSKHGKSVYLDFQCIQHVEKLVKRSRLKSFSDALNWIIRKEMSRKEFYKFMGRYHAGMTQHFVELQQQLEDEVNLTTEQVREEILDKKT